MTGSVRRLIALIVLAGLVVLTAPGPASATGKRARCAAKRSHTVAKNRLVRVYSVSRSGNRRLTACLRASGRKLLVVREYDDGYVESGAYRDVRLAGRFVAVVFDATDVSCKAAWTRPREQGAGGASRSGINGSAMPRAWIFAACSGGTVQIFRNSWSLWRTLKKSRSPFP